MNDGSRPQILRLVHRARPAGRRPGRPRLLQGRVPRVEGLPAQVHPGGNPPRRDAAATGAGRKHAGADPADPPARPQPRGPLHDLPSRGGRSELRRLSAAARLPSAARAASVREIRLHHLPSRPGPRHDHRRRARQRAALGPADAAAAIHPGLLRPMPRGRRQSGRARAGPRPAGVRGQRLPRLPQTRRQSAALSDRNSTRSAPAVRRNG